MKILEAKNINKYFENPVSFHVLKDISFSIDEGEFVSIMGKSGCGKSTLLYILSTMDTQYQGDLFFAEEKNEWQEQQRIGAYSKCPYWFCVSVSLPAA